MQSVIFQPPYRGEFEDGGVNVPSMKHNLLLACNAIFTDLLHDKKLFPINGVIPNVIP